MEVYVLLGCLIGFIISVCFMASNNDVVIVKGKRTKYVEYKGHMYKLVINNDQCME